MSIEEILRNGLQDGQFLDMQTRIFDISEVVMRAKPKPKPAPKPAPKPKDKRAEENPAAAAPGGDEVQQRQDDESESLGGTAAGDGDGDDDEEMEIAISSEYPVKRWYGTEILDHSPESVDMSRARRGLAFLLEHNTRDVIGIVENCRIDPDKKLRGNPRFSKNARPQEVKRDIKDGIRKDISVGYMAEEAVLEKQSDTEGNTYRITRWTPLEASSVAVPADPTVGHGRMVREGARMSAIKLKENPAPKPNTEVSIMATTEQETRTAAAEIFRLGKRHGIPDDQVLKMVEEGISIETASARILAEVEKKNARALPQPGAERVEDDFRLSESEQAEYNLARGIMALASNREYSEAGTNKRVNCFELEVSDVLEKQWSRAKHGGLFVPWSIKHARDENLERKYPRLYAMHKALRGAPGSGSGLDTTATGKGGALVFIEPGEFIQFLYNRMRIKELGARTLAGLRDNVAFPKQTGSVTGSWVGENTGADVADAALTLSQIPSSPKTYQSSTSYSRQLLAQAVVDIDTLVREDLAKNQALSLDLAAINGAVATPQLSPVGILNTTGVQTYDQPAAVNGWSPTWKDILVMSQKLEDVNADQLGTGGWLTTPGVKTNLKNTSRLANTIALPIWTDDDEVTGAPARSTNQVPKNGTMGSGTGLHTLIRGIFETIIVGMWGNGFELVVDPYRLKKQGMIELTTFMLADVVLTYPSAFVCTSHIIP
jgi:HK97 family phage major capsid protein